MLVFFETSLIYIERERKAKKVINTFVLLARNEAIAKIGTEDDMIATRKEKKIEKMQNNSTLIHSCTF